MPMRHYLHALAALLMACCATTSAEARKPKPTAPVETSFCKAFFQTSDDMFENDDNGLNWGIEGSDGYTAIAQVGWSPQLFKRQVYSTTTDAKDETRDGKTNGTTSQ